MPRQVYYAPGIPEDPEVTKQREQNRIDPSRQNWSPEMTRFLEKIDFDLLKSIFAKRAARYGIEEKDLNFIGPERMLKIPGGFYRGYYSEKNNTILIAEKEPWEQNTEDQKLWGNIEIEILATIIHEETHAVSKNECVGLIVESSPIEKSQESTKRKIRESFLYTQSGYNRSSDSGMVRYSDKNEYNVFHALNEGSVEKLSREILLEYLTTKKDQNPEAIKTLSETLKNNQQSLGYADEVKLVDAIVRRISSETGKTIADSWDIIVKGLFEGETFDESEAKKLFDNIFGPNFLKDLSRIHATFFSGEREKMDRLMNMYYLNNK